MAAQTATYAIVKTGGKQYKVAVGDVLKVEKIAPGPALQSPAGRTLVVDGAKVTTDAGELAKVSVTGEILEHIRARRSHPQVQEQDRLPQASGSPSAADGSQGHRNQ